MNRIESNRIMKMPFVLLTSTSSSSSVFISVLTIIILSILLLVLCEAVTTTTTTTITITTTSDYDSSSSSSSSSSRIQHHIVNNNNNPNPIINIAPAPPPLKFIRQDFADSNNNHFGQVSTTGVSVFDINNDGYNDILYSAGRHSIDQSYVIINLGPVYDIDIDIDIDIDNNSEGKKKFLRYKFSNPLSIGPRNGYFQIDVMNGKAFHGGIIEEENHHTGVLLVGGNCVITKKEKKEGKSLCPYDGYNTPSILLDVNIVSGTGTGTGTGTGCSVVPYNNSNTNMNSTSTSTESKFEYECQLDWKIIWTDIYPRKFVGGDSGDRNGAFVKSLTSVEDEHEQPPAIVLQGVDGIKIYEAMKHQKLNKHENGTTSETYYYYYYEYGNTTTYHIPTTKIAKKKQHRNKDGNNSNRNQKHYYKNINRFTGLAHGYVGTEPGFVSGPRTGSRTFLDEGPAPPLVAVIKDSVTGQYKHYEFGYNDNDYNGNSSLALQPTGLVLADINGDGSTDLLSTTFLYENEILNDYPLPQNYYLFPSSLSSSSSSSSPSNTITTMTNNSSSNRNRNRNSNINNNFNQYNDKQQQKTRRKLLTNDNSNNNNGKKSSSTTKNITKTTFDSLLSGGRSIATYNIYNLSPYNDIVLGTSARTITTKSNSNNNTIIIPATIRLYANKGVDVSKSNDTFLGFEFVQELVIGGSGSGVGLTENENNLDCSIRDITISSLSPPSLSPRIISIITALDCSSGSGNSSNNYEFGNVMFHAIIDDD